jgi:hypothetical protein
MKDLKNIDVVPVLDGIKKIENLKLGGVKLKKILKNKRELINVQVELEDVKKKLIEQHTDSEGKLNEAEANKEWFAVLNDRMSYTLEKVFSIGELDQFKDLTLEQYEILDLMSEELEVVETAE